MLTVLDLFSGIGGFSLGLERTGQFKTIAFCEVDPYCRAVLKKHWPEVPCFDDIATAEFSLGYADVICGGFPCQDISRAGRRAGITGGRSGLWRYMVDAIRVVQPRYVIVENVAAILDGDVGVVLGDLAEIGYDAEWHCIPASAVGAPHRRDRWWCVAYPAREQPAPRDSWVARQGRRELRNCGSGHGAIWRAEPNVGRVADGVPSQLERLKSLGNAVVPQIPELIGLAILAAST